MEALHTTGTLTRRTWSDALTNLLDQGSLWRTLDCENFMRFGDFGVNKMLDVNMKISMLKLV